MEQLKFAVGVLVRDGKCLAERRHTHEKHFAGQVVFPGGSIEAGETSEEALKREMQEELGVSVEEPRFLGNFLYEDGCSSDVFVVSRWSGEPEPREAEELLWVQSKEQLSNEYDRGIFELIERT